MAAKEGINVVFLFFFGGGGGVGGGGGGVSGGVVWGGVYVLQDAGSSEPDVMSCSHFILKVFPGEKALWRPFKCLLCTGCFSFLGNNVPVIIQHTEYTHIIQVYVSM